MRFVFLFHKLSLFIFMMLAMMMVSTPNAHATDGFYSCMVGGIAVTYKYESASHIRKSGAHCRVLSAGENLLCYDEGEAHQFRVYQVTERLRGSPNMTCLTLAANDVVDVKAFSQSSLSQ